MLIEGKTQEVLANQLLTSILSESRPGVWRDNSAAFGVDRANWRTRHWRPGVAETSARGDQRRRV